MLDGHADTLRSRKEGSNINSGSSWDLGEWVCDLEEICRGHLVISSSLAELPFLTPIPKYGYMLSLSQTAQNSFHFD